MLQINTLIGKVNIDRLPNDCPFCHKSVTPNTITGHKNDNILEIFMFCPDADCRKSFIGYFNASGSTWRFNGSTTQGHLIGKKFSETINEISPNFALIYNEAYTAEQQNLSEICGVGYRKSLEFLIKDYSILLYESEKEKIEKLSLAKCIKDFVADNRIKSVAKRAAWLGNDETHYIRKWEGKNLQDLKKLIELTVHWIEMEKLTESFENDMPE